jgi:hypothetical protein
MIFGKDKGGDAADIGRLCTNKNKQYQKETD